MSTEEKEAAFQTRFGVRFSHWTRPFWEGTKRGEFLVQQCNDCGSKLYPPKLYCPNCMSQSIEWIKATGKGKVFSYSVSHDDPPTSGVAKYLKAPYVVAIIELDEGVKIISNIVDCKPEDVRCDMNVEVVFRDIGEGVILPGFKPTRD